MIYEMSDSELTKLDQLIEKVKKKALKNKSEEKRQKNICKRISNAISKRRERALEVDTQLKFDILSQLEKINLTHIQPSPMGTIEYFYIEKEKLSMDDFIQKYFEDILVKIRECIAKNTIISTRKGQSAKSHLGKILNKVIDF